MNQLVGHLLIKEGELAPSEVIEEATTLVPNNSHDDAEPDTNAPTLVPTDHVVDEGESVPMKDVEKLTTLAPNDSLKDTINDDELDPIENIADYPTLDPKDSVNDDEQVTVVDVTAKTLPSSLAGLVFILLHFVTYCDFT